jgi:hypothetical protein
MAMNIPVLPPGHLRVLVEQPRDPLLVAAAQAVLSGQDPTQLMVDYSRRFLPFVIDHGFGAIPIGPGGRSDHVSIEDLTPEKSQKFLVRAFVAARVAADVQDAIQDEPVYSDPPAGRFVTCGDSPAVGTAQTVRTKLGADTLGNNGYDGSGVAIAIVDTGIYLKRIIQPLGAMAPDPPPSYDTANSLTPLTVATPAFEHSLDHGTMCAYDALIAAPNATLLDVSALIARAPGDHSVPGTVSAAIWAFSGIANRWATWIASGNPPYQALVISNSWGIYHPSLDPFPPGSPSRFIDNPNHVFSVCFTRPLSAAGVDILFAGNNCGSDCASATCLGKTDGMIMGANAYAEVLTLGGCDTNDWVVGYSSRGPSIPGMPPNKPDLVSYTHFLGSKTRRIWAPDTGVSAACPVAAGCVAALRTGLPPTAVPPSALFQALKANASTGNGSSTPGGNWNPDYGCGIINPVATGLALGLPFPNA